MQLSTAAWLFATGLATATSIPQSGEPPQVQNMDQAQEIVRINRCLKNGGPENCNVSEGYISFPAAKEKFEEAAVHNKRKLTPDLSIDQLREMARIIRCIKNEVPENCNVPEWFKSLSGAKEKLEEAAANNKREPTPDLSIDQLREMARTIRCIKNEVPEDCDVPEWFKSLPRAKEKLEEAAARNYIPPSVPRCLPGLQECRENCWAWIVTSPWHISECQDDCEEEHCPHDDEDGPVYEGGQ